MKKYSRTTAARLHFIAGQMTAIERMMASKRSCTDILTQLSAVRAGLEEVAGAVFQRELERIMTKKRVPQTELQSLIKSFKRTT